MVFECKDKLRNQRWVRDVGLEIWLYNLYLFTYTLWLCFILLLICNW